MHLRIGDKVRHIFDAKIEGLVVEIRNADTKAMSSGGTFLQSRYALIETKEGKHHWVEFSDIMKSP